MNTHISQCAFTVTFIMLSPHCTRGDYPFWIALTLGVACFFAATVLLENLTRKP